MIEGLVVTEQKVIATEGGDVFHGLKASEDQFLGFGEAYFSSVDVGFIKAWKKHLRMTLNLLVPHGKIGFVLFDDREGSPTQNFTEKVIISPENYSRLTIPPGIWLGFKGLGTETSLLLNVANIEHDPDEVENRTIQGIDFDWSELT